MTLITPHASCKYALLRHADVNDYLIVAVHALLDTQAFVSKRMQAQDGAHVWSVPGWVNTNLLVAMCQTSEAAGKYRVWLRQLDAEEREANVR